jgi:hypothetical protein
MGSTHIVKVLLDAGAYPDYSLLKSAIFHAYQGELGSCPSSSSRTRPYYERHGSTSQYCDIARILIDAGADSGTLKHEECRILQIMLGKGLYFRGH